MPISIDIDIAGFVKEIERLAFFKDASVTVGIHEKEGKDVKVTPSGDSKESLIDVSKKHEFGSLKIPQRSFIRSTFDNKRDHYFILVSIIANKVLSYLCGRDRVIA